MAKQPWHPDAAKIQSHLTKNGIAALYHFTAVDNLGMIFREGGLCSKAILEAKNLLANVVTGGNQLSLTVHQRSR